MVWLHTQYKKRKVKETCKYLCQTGFFFGHCTFSPVWNAFYRWGWREGQGRIPGTTLCIHTHLLTFRNDLSLRQPNCGKWFQTLLHPVPSLASCHLQLLQSLKSLVRSTFLQSFQQDLTRIWCWEHRGVQLTPSFPESLARGPWGDQWAVTLG